jgi:non-lysosomal glucosylceramidase
MSSWSTMLAMSGFRYDGPNQAVSTTPPARSDDFISLWATGTGWGRYSLQTQGGRTRLVLHVLGGELHCRSCELHATGESATVSSAGRSIQSQTSRQRDRAIVRLVEAVRVGEGKELLVEVSA